MQGMQKNTLLAVTLLSFLIGWTGAFAQKPSLVNELEAAIEAGGAEALQQRFNEIWPEQKNQYSVDMQALSQMMSEQARKNNGDYQVLNVLSRITGEVAEAQMQAMMASPDMQALTQAIEQAEQNTTKRHSDTASSEATADADSGAGAQANNHDSGPARQDLARFTGLYGEPDSPRKLFVSQTCDGYLLIGAMWGDVAPWQMVSMDENRFDNNNPHFHLEVSFETDASGIADKMQHTLNALPSPAERTSDLPQDWESCVQRTGR